MIKRCCDACDVKIEGEHIEVSFKESVLQSFGEYGSADSHEFCFKCHDKAIKLIYRYAKEPHREMKKMVKKIMNGE